MRGSRVFSNPVTYMVMTGGGYVKLSLRISRMPVPNIVQAEVQAHDVSFFVSVATNSSFSYSQVRIHDVH